MGILKNTVYKPRGITLHTRLAMRPCMKRLNGAVKYLGIILDEKDEIFQKIVLSLT